MTYKEITDLIKLVNKTDLTELKLKQKDFEIQIRTKQYSKETKIVSGGNPVISMPATGIATSAPAPTAPPEPAAITEKLPPQEQAADSNEGLVEIKSPIVGTFYRSSAPDKPPYKKVGDRVEKGEVVCIVEAMKLFNEIESEVSGTIVKVVIDDANPVEYDQALFLVDPNS